MFHSDSPKIVSSTGNILLDSGETARFECEVDANPFDQSMVTWQRLPTEPSDQDDVPVSEADNEDATSVSTSSPNYGYTSRYRSFAVTKTNSEEPDGPDEDPSTNGRYVVNVASGRSTFTIHNVTTDDTGIYRCIISNGIGSAANVSNQLVVRHSPILRLWPNVAKSASDSGSIGRLVCRVTAAPDVQFNWFKDEQLLASESSNGSSIPVTIPTAIDHSTGSATHSHHFGVAASPSPAVGSLSNAHHSPSSIGLVEKFSLGGIRRIGLATFESSLLIQDVRPSDYGLYSCRAQNRMGSASAEIRFSKPSRPDRPVSLRAVNRTAISITMRWGAAFDGGLTQRFRLRYKPIAYLLTKSKYVEVDIDSPEARDHTVTGLQPGTEYAFSIQAINDLGQSDYTNEIVRESTLDGN